MFFGSFIFFIHLLHALPTDLLYKCRDWLNFENGFLRHLLIVDANFDPVGLTEQFQNCRIINFSYPRGFMVIF